VSLTSYKNQLKMDLKLNVGPGSMKGQEENAEYFNRQGSFWQDPKAQEIKAETYKWNYIKLKSSAQQRKQQST
jgi:hypothetical protein